MKDLNLLIYNYEKFEGLSVIRVLTVTLNIKKLFWRLSVKINKKLTVILDVREADEEEHKARVLRIRKNYVEVSD